MIKTLILTLIMTTSIVMAQTPASISPIDAKIKARMFKGHSWKASCPVPLFKLRYLRIPYIDFNGMDQLGEMIVHRDVAQDVVEVFAALYESQYPIHKMHLVSDYKGSDWQSIEADNTSAFNCRNATGSKHWSKHSYGKAIDINSIENPYISRKGHISHKASLKYRKRVHCKHTLADKAVILKRDEITKLFKRHGWKWGGDWPAVKDYQHFFK